MTYAQQKLIGDGFTASGTRERGRRRRRRRFGGRVGAADVGRRVAVHQSAILHRFSLIN